MESLQELMAHYRKLSRLPGEFHFHPRYLVSLAVQVVEPGEEEFFFANLLASDRLRARKSILELHSYGVPLLHADFDLDARHRYGLSLLRNWIVKNELGGGLPSLGDYLFMEWDETSHDSPSSGSLESLSYLISHTHVSERVLSLAEAARDLPMTNRSPSQVFSDTEFVRDYLDNVERLRDHVPQFTDFPSLAAYVVTAACYATHWNVDRFTDAVPDAKRLMLLQVLMTVPGSTADGLLSELHANSFRIRLSLWQEYVIRDVFIGNWPTVGDHVFLEWDRLRHDCGDDKQIAACEGLLSNNFRPQRRLEAMSYFSP